MYGIISGCEVYNTYHNDKVLVTYGCYTIRFEVTYKEGGKLETAYKYFNNSSDTSINELRCFLYYISESEGQNLDESKYPDINGVIGKYCYFEINSQGCIDAIYHTSRAINSLRNVPLKKYEGVIPAKMFKEEYKPQYKETKSILYPVILLDSDSDEVRKNKAQQIYNDGVNSIKREKYYSDRSIAALEKNNFSDPFEECIRFYIPLKEKQDKSGFAEHILDFCRVIAYKDVDAAVRLVENCAYNVCRVTRKIIAFLDDDVAIQYFYMKMIDKNLYTNCEEYLSCDEEDYYIHLHGFEYEIALIAYTLNMRAEKELAHILQTEYFYEENIMHIAIEGIDKIPEEEHEEFWHWVNVYVDSYRFLDSFLDCEDDFFEWVDDMNKDLEEKYKPLTKKYPDLEYYEDPDDYNNDLSWLL